MIRLGTTLLVMTAAACAGQTDVVSSMNFVQQPVDPVCAHRAVAAVDGFAVTDTIAERGGARQFEAIFNKTVPVSVILRQLPDATSEVSAFSRFPDETSPLKRKEIKFAVEAADDAIYRSCTADGKIGGDTADVTIETTENN